MSRLCGTGINVAARYTSSTPLKAFSSQVSPNVSTTDHSRTTLSQTEPEQDDHEFRDDEADDRDAAVVERSHSSNHTEPATRQGA